MENASNALIMAAGILLGVMIITLAVALFLTFGSTTGDIAHTVYEREILSFNVQFEQYIGVELRPHDVVNIIKMMAENNNKRGFTDISHTQYLGEDYFVYISGSTVYGISVGNPTRYTDEANFIPFIEQNALSDLGQDLGGNTIYEKKYSMRLQYEVVEIDVDTSINMVRSVIFGEII